MEEIIKWIIENKEFFICACICICVSIPISVHFGKTIINNNIKKNNTINRYGSSPPTKQNPPKRPPNNQTISQSKRNVELTSIHLYSTGTKGKVYTSEFYKSMNHNFGIEITLKNNTSIMQNVKVGWCIYKNGQEIINGAFNKKVNPNNSLTTDFYVKKQAFNSLKTGKYKSQFWVNNQRVQKVYFTISNK